MFTMYLDFVYEENPEKSNILLFLFWGHLLPWDWAGRRFLGVTRDLEGMRGSVLIVLQYLRIEVVKAKKRKADSQH